MKLRETIPKIFYDMIARLISKKERNIVKNVSSTKSPPAMKVPLSEIAKDKAMSERKFQRKVVVTTQFEKEYPVSSPTWTAPTHPGDPCAVLWKENIEMAYFNQKTPQDRHYHKMATEFYIVKKGTLKIEVDGDQHVLETGDTLVVNPYAQHEVLIDDPDKEMLCQVITANCHGKGDKYASGPVPFCGVPKTAKNHFADS